MNEICKKILYDFYGKTGMEPYGRLGRFGKMHGDLVFAGEGRREGSR